MSFEINLILLCDGCGAEENYGSDFDFGENLAPPPIPKDWEADYDDGASLFKHICPACIESIKEEVGAVADAITAHAYIEPTWE